MAAAADEELLERYLRLGETPEGRAAVDELFERYHRRVALWCLRIAGDREKALDLAQEVFIRAYRGLAAFRGGSKFSTWLYTIARNHCFNEAKARARRPEETSEPEWVEMLAATEQDQHERLERRQAEELASKLVESELDETERRAIILHYREELPLDAVGSLLGLKNASGAKAPIVSAKRKLKKAWERRQASQRPSRGIGV